MSLNRSTSTSLVACLLVLFLHGTAFGTLLRIAAWNTANRPNDTEQAATFSTVLGAMGHLDILAVSETDTGSSADLVDIMNAVNGVTSYAVATSNSDSGGDRTGFVYDTSSVILLNDMEVPGGLTHNTLRGEFRSLHYGAAADFFMYAVHLKSGSSSSDRTTRGAEAAAIRADANALGDGTSIIYAGDFNMRGSSEEAWGALVDPNAGQAFDVANAPGEWRDNPAFINLHTQDAGDNMDDRFDIQFVTGELLDGVGLDYVPGSFEVFGNNGTHLLGDSINTGLGASPDVLAALTDASDHLPILAEFKLVPEPSAFILAAIGLVCVGWYARRRRFRSA